MYMRSISVLSILFIIHFALIRSFSIPQTQAARGEITCKRLQRMYRHIQCESDGSFSPIQCRNRYCTCVNVTTGKRMGESFMIKDRDMYNCSKISCGEVMCKRYCPNGYQKDRQGCKLCSCIPTDCKYDSPRALIRTGCHQRCIERIEMCYNCTCNSTGAVTPVRCGNYQKGVKRGYGWGTCREKLQNNETCERPLDEGEEEEEEDEENNQDDILQSLPESLLALLSSQEEDEMIQEVSEKARRALIGSSARRASRSINKPIRSCRPGYYCRRNGLKTGQCKPVRGPCYSRFGNSSDSCDNNGYYKPRYCQRVGHNKMMIRCMCVHPLNGTNITNTEVTFTNTGNRDRDEAKKPMCSVKVYGVCHVIMSGRNYTVRHGRYHVDHCSCRLCRCFFGVIYCQEKTNCTTVCPTTVNSTCILSNGTTVGHGHISKVDCNRCICRYGRLYCSDRDCNTTATNDCRRCLSQRVDKVCAPNGKTYINRCFAIYCAGVASVDLLDGPCPSIDACRIFPCQTGEVCLKRGGVSCLALENGCHPNTLRFCVNITNLECDNDTTASVVTRNDTDRDGDGVGDGDVDPYDTSVCATDGVTYSSTCHLLQNTININVLHAGRCNATQCRGGLVCGTDGVTYDNICALRTLSDNARLDYRGGCINDTELTAEEMCSRVRSSGLCRYNITNCPYCLVQPVVGCCPICGGAVLAILDREGVSNASAIDSELETLDGLLNRVISNEEFFLKPANSCAIEASLTTGGNIELIMTPHVNSTSCYCGHAASNITSVLNGTMSYEEISSAYQYILGATEAKAVIGKSIGGTTGGSPAAKGGGSVAISSFILVLTTVLLTTALLSQFIIQ